MAGWGADKVRKDGKDFYLPGWDCERSLYGSELEIQLGNKRTEMVGTQDRFMGRPANSTHQIG